MMWQKRTKTIGLIVGVIMLLIPMGWDVAWAQPIGKAHKNIEFGQEAAVYLDGKKIGIGDAIRLAIESNYDLLSGAYELAMLDSNYRMYQKKYSTFLSVEGSGSYQEYPDGTAILTGTDSQSWSGSAALVKNFATGTQLAFGVAHNKTTTSYLPLAFEIPGLGTVEMSAFGDPDYNQSTAFLSVKQELLQNGLGHNDQLEQKQIANAGFMQKDYILYQLSLVVVKVVMDYWDTVLKESALTNAKLQYEETKYVRDITAHNVDLGTTNRFELHYYNVLVAGAEAQWKLAQQNYANAKRAFMRSINLNDAAVLEGAAVLINQMPVINEADALKRAYAKRADYLGAKRMLDHSNWELAMAKNLALPSLTAELAVNTLGQQTEVSDALQDMVGGEQIGYTGSLALMYPLGGDPVQKVKERNARFALKQAEIAVDKYERLIKDDIHEQIEQMQTLFELYQTSKKARIEAETFYQSMMGQLRRGRLNASMVKNGVDALASARQQELETLISFNIIQLQFIATKNELFETYGIDPDQYIPK